MKNIYILCLAVLLYSTGFSQRSISGSKPIGNISYTSGAENSKISSSVCDTVGNFDPSFMTPTNYTVSPGGYVAGHNLYGDIAKAEHFEVPGGITTIITGAKIMFALANAGSPISAVDVKIWEGSTGTPGIELASTSILINSIDTNIPTYINFPPISVNGDYFIGITINYANPLDTVAIITSSDFESPVNTAWEQWDDGTWYSYDDPSTWGLTLSHAIWSISCGDYNSINGKVFLDLNSNNIQDAGDEPGIKNHIIQELNTGSLAASKTDGTYKLAVVDTGLFTVTPSPIVNFNITPATYTAYFSSINEIDSLNDFAFQPTSVVNDLQITITPVGAFRPGFNAYYNIYYKNAGTVPLSPTIIFYPDTNLTFVSSIPSPSSVTPDSIVWNIPTLNPFDEGNILVTVNVNPNTPLGSWINSQAGVQPLTGDANPLDNVASWRIIITGSYDPNDILVNRSSILTTEFPNPPILEYIIRFQNTGTDTAFTIRISNPFPMNVELLTFEFIGNSHPVDISFDFQSQEIEFLFQDILLPDSNVNEPMSHGFVRYKVKPLSTLGLGDLIENTASIFFDFNAPVITNTAVTEIVLPTSVPGIKNNFDFSIYPNPSIGEVNISFTLKEEKEIKIELFNSLGQVVKTISQQKFTAGKNQINFTTENLSKGIYHIKFSVDENVSVKRLVKM